MAHALLFCASVLAAPTAGQPSGQFVPVSGGPPGASAATLLVTAYLVMWALLVLFIYFGWRRQQRIEARVEHLEKALAKVDAEAQNRAASPPLAAS